MSNDLEFAKAFAKEVYDLSEVIVVNKKQYTKRYSTADAAYTSGIKGAIYQNGNEYIVRSVHFNARTTYITIIKK